MGEPMWMELQELQKYLTQNSKNMWKTNDRIVRICHFGVRGITTSLSQIQAPQPFEAGQWKPTSLGGGGTGQDDWRVDDG